MKKSLVITLLFALSFISLAQDLSYLNPVGFNLSDDIKNGSALAFPDDITLNTFLQKAIVPKLGKDKSETEKAELTAELKTALKEEYTSVIAKTKSLLSDNGFYMEELDLYGNIPLTKEVVESKFTSSFSAPDTTKDNLSAITCIFLVGDLDKRVVLEATVIALNNTYTIVELKQPYAYYTFLTTETYGSMYQQLRLILEKKLTSSSSVAAMIDGDPLIGAKYNDEWNKCTIQLFDEETPTLIKTTMDGDNWMAAVKTTIKASLFEHISKNKGRSLMKEILSVFSQQFNIYATEDNKLNSDKIIKPYTLAAITVDKEKDITTASIQLKDGSGDKVIYTLELVMFPDDKGTYNVDLFLRE